MGYIIFFIVISLIFVFIYLAGSNSSSSTQQPQKTTPIIHTSEPQITRYTVRFESKGHVLKVFKVEEGYHIEPEWIPNPGSEERHKFCFWSEDDEKPFDFSRGIFSAVTLHAVWERKAIIIQKEIQILPWYKWICRNDRYWCAEVGGHRIELVPSTHSYTVDGCKVPSITEIIDRYGDADYSDVDQYTLDEAKRKALELQDEIELYEMKDWDGNSREWKNYLELKKHFPFKPLYMRLMVAIFDEQGNPMAAGTLCSLLQNKDGSYGIMGIKRTRDYYAKNVKLQLNLYRIGLMQCSGKEVSTLDCLRLKDTLSEHHIVPIDEEDAWEFLEEYLPYCEEDISLF